MPTKQNNKKLFDVIKKNDLHLWVFVTGAIVLIIEVVAVRILAPYFGNTLFSISSVLSVVLLALSAGYWYGGKLADKSPDRIIFYGIIATSGFLLLMMEAIREPILELASEALSLTTGPLISSIILFIGPAFMLGMLSPMAIKIKTVENPKMGVGTVTGGVFFWSTLGSISGSLLAGFVLIPNFGIDIIMLAISLILIFMGAIPLTKSRLVNPKVLVVLVLLSTGIGIFATAVQSASEPGVLHDQDGVYEHLTVREYEHEGRRARLLEQDRSHSGAVYVDSDDLVFDYAEYSAIVNAFNIQLDDILTVGGGTYTIPRYFLSHSHQPNIDVVEIEPSLIDLAYRYFGLPFSDRLTNYVDDGRRFVNQTDKKYDFMFVDVYQALFSVPVHFTTQEFFELARNHLTDDGILISNIIGDQYDQGRSFLLSEMKTFDSVFENSYFFNVSSSGSKRISNYIFLGVNGKQKIDFKSLRDDPNPILANLEDHVINVSESNLEQQILLTDDYAPVDFLIMQMLNRNNF